MYQLFNKISIRMYILCLFGVARLGIGLQRFARTFDGVASGSLVQERCAPWHSIGYAAHSRHDGAAGSASSLFRAIVDPHVRHAP